MTRFRPNLVVGGAPAWAEDDWVGRPLRIGDLSFRAAGPCNRCVVTTTDQETGVRTKEPLRTSGGTATSTRSSSSDCTWCRSTVDHWPLAPRSSSTPDRAADRQSAPHDHCPSMLS